MICTNCYFCFESVTLPKVKYCSKLYDLFGYTTENLDELIVLDKRTECLSFLLDK